MVSTIVVGIDGAAGGEDALALAERLAGEGTTVVAVGVSPTVSEPPRLAADDEDPGRAEPVRRQASAHGIEAEFVLARSVAAGLHDAAERHGADVIVIGSSRRGAIGRILDGDDIRATIREAPCAVAIAPRTD